MDNNLIIPASFFSLFPLFLLLLSFLF